MPLAGEIVKKIAESHPHRVSDLVGLEWGLKSCTSNKFPDHNDSVGVGTTSLRFCESECGPERKAKRKLLTLLLTQKSLDRSSWRPGLHSRWASLAGSLQQNSSLVKTLYTKP